jgi:hypothetical protein
MPFKLLVSVPAYDLSVPVRMSVLADLGVTMTVAFAFDALIGRLAGSRRRSPADRPGLLARLRHAEVLVPALLAAAVLAPLLPSAPVVSVPYAPPRYFSSPAVRRIAAGAVVLAYPYPESADNQAMLWQVASGFRFRIIGGYVLTPWDPKARYVTGGGGYDAAVLTPSVVPQVLFEAALGQRSVRDVFPVAPWSKAALRLFIRRYGVDDIVAAQLGLDPAYIVSFLTGALGERPIHDHKLAVWYDVQRSPLLEPPPAAPPPRPAARRL